MVTDVGVKDGLMQMRTFLVDTKDATLAVHGAINLRSEEIGLEIRPESKGVRIISLRSPLYIGGTFKKPDVGVDKKAIALRAGAATAVGVVAAPLAALVALTQPGPDQPSPCAALLPQAAKKPKAPPPGKTAAQR
jgi:uncharacterized protein involved in outer membrane biogenesis